jgi:drug/metabolite transporter (DMT)-like permease
VREVRTRTGQGALGTEVLKGAALVLAGATCWGLNGTISQALMSLYHVDAIWLTAIKQLGGFWLFLLCAHVQTPGCIWEVVSHPRSLFSVIVCALTTIVLLQVSYMQAILWTNAGTATVLQSLNLLMVLAYVCITTHRTPKRREVLGIACALVGIYLLAFGGISTELYLPLPGLIWGLLTALGQSMLSIVPVKLVRRWGNFVVNGLSFLLAGIMLSVFSRPWEHVPALDGAGIALLLGAIFIGTFGAYVFYMQGLKIVGSMKATLLGTAEPVVATLSAALVLNTAFLPTDFVGFALIIAMVFITA